MHPKKIINLIALSPEERFDYFIRTCADSEKVWGLVVGEDNWVIFKDNKGDEIFPLWPHKELAQECCFSEHVEMNAQPQMISFEVFVNECISDMEEHGVLFGIFYDKSREGYTCEPSKLKAQLIQEHEELWG
ncbi:MAG: DUF2750 domain-containing protein [Kangiellaceae bacterium]|nr:DUF2750 domain-containing protein [Kangiellaceae bacterium]MCW9016670.1 DUF2750 domain-containing protein [Kangiellaceae bacterium]